MALFKQLVQRANQGEQLAIDRLREFLDHNPHIWRRAGDLTEVAESAWIERIAGKDEFRRESIRRYLAEMKAELKGNHPTRLESLLADQIAVSWLSTRAAQIQAASPAGTSLNVAAFRLKRSEWAQKQFLVATKTLATLRELMPKGLVPHEPPAKGDLRLFPGKRELA